VDADLGHGSSVAYAMRRFPFPTAIAARCDAAAPVASRVDG
jgi:hypothetical protein